MLNSPFLEFTTVKLTPFTVIDPFSTVLNSEFLYSKVKIQLPIESSMFLQMAIPST